jgi:hypothetical protein
VTRTVMTATTTISAPTTIITVPCVADDSVMDSRYHCTAARPRDKRHLHPPISKPLCVKGGCFGRVAGGRVVPAGV